MSEPVQFVTDSERHRALRIAFNPMEAPITLDTICLLSLALRDAEARAAPLSPRTLSLTPLHDDDEDEGNDGEDDPDRFGGET